MISKYKIFTIPKVLPFMKNSTGDGYMFRAWCWSNGLPLETLSWNYASLRLSSFDVSVSVDLAFAGPKNNSKLNEGPQINLPFFPTLSISLMEN